MKPPESAQSQVKCSEEMAVVPRTSSYTSEHTHCIVSATPICVDVCVGPAKRMPHSVESMSPHATAMPHQVGYPGMHMPRRSTQMLARQNAPMQAMMQQNMLMPSQHAQTGRRSSQQPRANQYYSPYSTGNTMQAYKDGSTASSNMATRSA